MTKYERAIKRYKKVYGDELTVYDDHATVIYYDGDIYMMMILLPSGSMYCYEEIRGGEGTFSYGFIDEDGEALISTADPVEEEE